jgi:N-acyl-D-amino-acid deacylase
MDALAMRLHFWLTLLGGGLFISVVCESAGAASAYFDLILRHGMIVDGTGLPGYSADIGIRHGYIIKIGDLSRDHADKEVDISGEFVAPGFINIHDHLTPEGIVHAENMLSQGVTTEIFNPDGAPGAGLHGTQLGKQLDELSARGLATNIGGYIGFNDVWESVVGFEDRRPSPDDIRKMQDLIARNLQEGAFGVSAGLDYKPGYFAETEEVIQVARPAGMWRTNFPNHERLTPESDFSSLIGISETITIASAAGVHPEITHIKVQGKEQGKAAQVISMMAQADKEGNYTPSDVYPYTAGQTNLDQLLVPAWAASRGRAAMLARFKDPAQRQKIIPEIERAMRARFNGPEGVYIISLKKLLTEVMKERNVGAGEAVIELLEHAPDRAILRFGSENDLQLFLKNPDTAIACDCGADLSPTHPRATGTFPKVLGHYVREEHLLTWQEAIRKMSALPASTIGLVDRGQIQPGMRADLTVFNPDHVSDRSTFDQPTLVSQGIEDVIVNGVLARENGVATEKQGGQQLRRAEHMPTRPLFMGSRKITASHTIPERMLNGNAAPMRLRLSVMQAASSHHATGSFQLVQNGRTVLELTSFGDLQIDTGWASFTGMARLTNGKEEPVIVIVDGNDPMQPGKTFISVKGPTFQYAAYCSADILRINRAPAT